MADQFSIRAMYGQANAFVDADSNGGTDISIVAAKSGYQTVIDTLVITASAAASAFIESGASTVIFPTVYLAAGDNFVLEGGNLFRSATNEAVTFSATVTGNISVFVQYHFEPGA